MGNELFSEYTIEKTHFLTGGHLNLWKIYRGVHKERKNKVCVFVFDKKQLESYPQREREDLLQLLKKEANFLAKFKHPNILSLIEPLAEDKYSLGFITESFSFSISTWSYSYKPSKLEVKLITTELVEALSFLHNDCHVVHLNINPNTVFINESNHIKISGLNFSKSTGEKNNEINYPINYYSEVLNQDLAYTAPEIVYQSKGYTESDIFSLGAIVFFLLTKNDLITLNGNSAENYKRAVGYIQEKIKQLEEEDKNFLLKLVDKNEKRPTSNEIQNLPWFTDPKLKGLCFVENLTTNDLKKNYEFLKQLPKILNVFEVKLIKNRFLPSLLGGLKVESLINPILPAVFAICENESNNVNFEEVIWPRLKELFRLKQIPGASLYFLLSKIQYIGGKISLSEFTNHCIPIICKAMDCGVPQIQGVVVDNLNFVSNSIDSSVFCKEIYPRIIQILLHTKTLQLKLRLLSNLRSLFSLLDQNRINFVLLNDLESLLQKDCRGTICSQIILIYEEISRAVSTDAARIKIIPTLVNIGMNGRISKDTFEKVEKVIEKYLDKIKKAREKDFSGDNDFEKAKAEIEKKAPAQISKGDSLDGNSFLSTFFADDNEDNEETALGTEEQPERAEKIQKIPKKESSIFDNFDNMLKDDEDNEEIEGFASSKKTKISPKSISIVPQSKKILKSNTNEVKPSTVKKIDKSSTQNVFDSLLNDFGNDDNDNDIDSFTKPKKIQIIKESKTEVKEKPIKLEKETFIEPKKEIFIEPKKETFIEPKKVIAQKEEAPKATQSSKKAESSTNAKPKHSGWDDGEDEDDEDFSFKVLPVKKVNQTPEPTQTKKVDFGEFSSSLDVKSSKEKENKKETKSSSRFMNISKTKTQERGGGIDFESLLDD